MEIKRKIEIKIATQKRFVIRAANVEESLFCPQCAEPLVTAEQAADLLGISRRAIYRLAEDGKIYHAETAAGVLAVCLNSMPERTDSDEI